MRKVLLNRRDEMITSMAFRVGLLCPLAVVISLDEEWPTWLRLCTFVFAVFGLLIIPFRKWAMTRFPRFVKFYFNNTA